MSQLRYKQSIVYLALGIITSLFVSSITISYSSLYAQQQQLKQNNSTSTALAGVKIISPTRDQQVPVGSLKISGTSTDKATPNDCTVYAIWDHLKPYQKVLANGPGGANDYSKWSFTYTSVYHLITNGTNELTAKISCLSSSPPSSASNLTKWYSINVTGIAAPLNQTKMPVPTTTTIPNTTTSDTASSVLTNSSLFPSPLTRVNLNNSNDNNNDDEEEDSSNGKVDKNKGDHKEDNTASNNNNNNDDDSNTNNSSPKPHDKDDNSKSKTATHHHDGHGDKEAKHIIKEKIKEVKHKIKHLKNEINKK